MSIFRKRKYSMRRQYLISISLTLLVSLFCFFTVDLIGYQAVALILLLVVSLTAILFDIFPVLVAAFLSAFIWNFFFIPPTLTFYIGTPEDALLFLMYFVIALINAVLTHKIREFERVERDKVEKGKIIKLYNTLLNCLSHELRTPISTIIGSVDTIRNNENRITEENRKELYNEIAIAGFRLNRQVENLLSMSRLEAGILQPKLDWCDINELTFEVIRQNQEDATRHEVVFEPNEQLPLFKTDRLFIEQIMQNLLHNALHHTPDGTLVKLEAMLQSKGFCVIISDNGKGFTEEEKALVFDKFYRLEQSQTGGTGLGLSIAKGFAEALGGSILLTDNPPGGAKFSIFIPAASAPIKHTEDEQS